MSNTKKISISFMLSLGILLVCHRHLPMVDKLSLKLTIQASVCIISVKRVAVTAKTTIDDGICQIYFYNKPLHLYTKPSKANILI